MVEKRRKRVRLPVVVVVPFWVRRLRTLWRWWTQQRGQPILPVREERAAEPCRQTWCCCRKVAVALGSVLRAEPWGVPLVRRPD